MWITRYRCVKCKKYMSWDAMFENHGTCPHCAETNWSSIVDCEKVPHKVVTWWDFKFPFKHTIYIPKDEWEERQKTLGIESKIS